MAVIRCLFFLTLFTGGSATGPTPIQKVIQLITELKAKVETDGIAAATAYQAFANECLAQSTSKSALITTTKDSIDSTSSTIAQKSNQRDEKRSRLAKLLAEIAKAEKDKAAMAKKCADELADDHKSEAKFLKSIAEMDSTVKESPSELIKEDTMYDMMDMVADPENKAKLVQKALLQGSAELEADLGGPNGDLIGILDVMKKDFDKQLGDPSKGLLGEMATKATACTQAKRDFTITITNKKGDRDVVSTDIQQLDTDIGTARGALVGLQTTMLDADEYMKDLTSECQDRANDWDQRSKQRADESTALGAALATLTGSVQSADAVNKRNSAKDRVGLVQKSVPNIFQAVPKGVDRDFGFAASMLEEDKNEEDAALLQTPVSLLQLQRKQVAKPVTAFLATSQEARRSHALAHLASEGQRIGSLALVELSQRARKDPFFKIKKLIDALIRRLIHEATSESSKVAFCKGELTKARKERDYRWKKNNKIAAKLEGLLAYEEELELTILTLSGTVIPGQKQQTLDGSTARKNEQATNMQTLKTARGGLAALQLAMKTLKDFYKKAATASFMQESASPLNMNGNNAAKGSSKGSQGASKAIIGLLSTIESDFQRTIRKTTASEKKAARDWVKAASDIAVAQSESESTLKFSREELVATKSDIKMKLIDLANTQGLLDNALAQLLKLKPTCIDSGMSYKERVAKREGEMTALQNALCMLDQEGVESDCTAQTWSGAAVR